MTRVSLKESSDIIDALKEGKQREKVLRVQLEPLLKRYEKNAARTGIEYFFFANILSDQIAQTDFDNIPIENHDICMDILSNIACKESEIITQEMLNSADAKINNMPINNLVDWGINKIKNDNKKGRMIKFLENDISQVFLMILAEQQEIAMGKINNIATSSPNIFKEFKNIAHLKLVEIKSTSYTKSINKKSMEEFEKFLLSDSK